MDLQELITRGRFLFSGAPGRHDVFVLVNGKRSAREIADNLKRHVNNVNRDLKALCDAGLIQQRLNSDGSIVKRGGQQVFEKIPLARTVPTKYFAPTGKRPKLDIQLAKKNNRVSVKKKRSRHLLPVPGEKELLDMCKRGEDQILEFKGQGTDVKKIVREIAAMLNTTEGGLIFFGVSDDGSIEGAGISRQKFDQQLQNAVKDSIDPSPVVRLHEVEVLGSSVLVVQVPPWDGRQVYHNGGRTLIRKGTNVFTASANEARRLHEGEAVI